ncbi:MAG TPA: carnitine 3-dehydrogenase [Paracoccaceae bacterium]|nr:carnitine 3-dehydrogenase [Paracoccaceae bacterium]
MKVAIVGGGGIGGGWTARFLLNGWDVSVYDPGPTAQANVAAMLANARLAVPALSDGPMPPQGRLSFAGTLAEALDGADYVQESVSERLEIKHSVYAQMQRSHPDLLIGSSTSGYKAVDLQRGAAAPGNIIVAHPFTPVYLLPLCEISASAANSAATIARTRDIVTEVGMFPLVMRKEIDAFIGSRFLEAVWREALWMLKDGVATTEEIDDAIRMSFGLRWAQMGLFENYRIAGGEAGMRHFMAQFGPALKWPWTRLTDVPEFNDELVDLVAGQSDAQSGHMHIRDLERLRDRNLVGILRSLKDRNVGAGRILNEHDARRRQAMAEPLPDTAAPLEMARMTVLPSWIDYNGHMTESRYLFACSETTDAFLRHIGADLDYVNGGHSYYTAETHILHRGEAKAGDAITGTVQVLAADDKRLHVFVTLRRGDEVMATLEQMLLHVDMKAGRTCTAAPQVLARLRPIAEAHAALPRPEGAGRFVGQRRA